MMDVVNRRRKFVEQWCASPPLRVPVREGLDLVAERLCALLPNSGRCIRGFRFAERSNENRDRRFRFLVVVGDHADGMEPYGSLNDSVRTMSAS